MYEIIFKIWWMIAILPFIIFIEGSKMLGDFLKKKNTYLYWDIYHAFLVVAIILLIVFYFEGIR